MKIIEKNNSGRTALLGAVLLAAGVALLGWSLPTLPHWPAHGFPWAFLFAVGGLKLIVFGGRYLEPLLPGRGRDRHRAGYRSWILFALIVIVAGVMLMGFNSGILAHEWKRVFFSWQMLLVVIGLVEYTHIRVTSGTVLVVVGGFFIVWRLAEIYPDIARLAEGGMWWPVLLIVVGVLVLGGIFFKPRCAYHHHVGGRCSHRHVKGHRSEGGGDGTDSTDGAQEGGGTDAAARANYRDAGYGGGRQRASGVIDIEVIFGGCEQVYLDPVFRGGSITTVFGGVKLDLRRTSLPEGETHLKVEAVFGGVEIDAPEEWIIEVRSEAVFGGFNDKRLPPVGAGYTDGRKLVVSVSSIFGGGEIK